MTIFFYSYVSLPEGIAKNFLAIIPETTALAFHAIHVVSWQENGGFVWTQWSIHWFIVFPIQDHHFGTLQCHIYGSPLPMVFCWLDTMCDAFHHLNLNDVPVLVIFHIRKRPGVPPRRSLGFPTAHNAGVGTPDSSTLARFLNRQWQICGDFRSVVGGFQ